MNELTILLADENAAPVEKKSRKWKLGSRFRLRIFASILSRLLKGGIPLLQALEILEEESDRNREKDVLRQIQEEVRQGKSLSEALAGMPDLFPFDFVHILQAGEASGALDSVLMESSQHLEKKEETARRIKEASAYPCFILFLGFTTLFILLKAVVPKVIRERRCECASALQYAILTDRKKIPAKIKENLKPLLRKYFNPPK